MEPLAFNHQPTTAAEASAKSLGRAPLALGEAMKHTVASVEKDVAEIVVGDPGGGHGKVGEGWGWMGWLRVS